jgi:hypothetical protein
MRTRLLIFRSLAHDAEGVLAGIHRLALVRIKLCLNIGTWRRKARLELSVAPFAYADGRRGPLYNAQLALLHDCSLAHLAGMA